MKKQITILFLSFFLSSAVFGQLTQDYSLISPNDKGRVVLSGDPTQNMPFFWNNGKGSQTIGVNYDYTIMLDTLGGDISTPIDNITKSCCASSFQDSSLHFTIGQWSSFLNGVYQNLYGRDFKIGDSLQLIWKVNLSAAAPGPQYEFRESMDVFEVTFVRGQLNDEYVPVILKSPALMSTTFIQGNPNQTIDFSWSAAYCPSGCAVASYDLLIDTVNGDFLSPYYSISVPNNDSAWSVNYNTFNQLLKDCNVAENGSRTIYWKVLAYGNSQVQFTEQTGFINLYNGLLDNENKPFTLISPPNNGIITLTGAASTQLNYKWHSTYTPQTNAATYFLVFDTVDASPLFNKPVISFKTPNNGSDTAINLTYGMIDHALDSVYPGWTKVNLMWGAKALLNGTFYYPEESYNIEFRSGVLLSETSIKEALLKLYPNPAQNTATIQLNAQEARVELFNSSGAKVYEQTLVLGENQIALAQLPNGVYLVRVRSGDALAIRRLVVQH